MDEDLNGMSREKLIDEVKRLRAGIRNTATAAVRISAGIIPIFGGCCRSVWLRKSQFHRGRTFCGDVSNTENPWIVNYRRRL
jgi:hypothetical protein